MWRLQRFLSTFTFLQWVSSIRCQWCVHWLLRSITVHDDTGQVRIHTLTLENLKITKPTIIAWHSQPPLSPLPCDTRVTNTDIDHVVQLLSSDPGWWREKVKWILCWAAAATINHQIRLSKLCPDDESLGQHWNSLSYFLQKYTLF